MFNNSLMECDHRPNQLHANKFFTHSISKSNRSMICSKKKLNASLFCDQFFKYQFIWLFIVYFSFTLSLFGTKKTQTFGNLFVQLKYSVSKVLRNENISKYSLKISFHSKDFPLNQLEKIIFLDNFPKSKMFVFDFQDPIFGKAKNFRAPNTITTRYLSFFSSSFVDDSYLYLCG